MNEFDITSTYAFGDHVIFDGTKYVYERRYEFSVGTLPVYGEGWIKDGPYRCTWIDYDPSIPYDHVTFCYTDSEPNEPTVLECKDKMINDIKPL